MNLEKWRNEYIDAVRLRTKRITKDPETWPSPVYPGPIEEGDKSLLAVLFETGGLAELQRARLDGWRLVVDAIRKAVTS